MTKTNSKQYSLFEKLNYFSFGTIFETQLLNCSSDILKIPINSQSKITFYFWAQEGAFILILEINFCISWAFSCGIGFISGLCPLPSGNVVPSFSLFADYFSLTFLDNSEYLPLLYFLFLQFLHHLNRSGHMHQNIHNQFLHYSLLLLHHHLSLLELVLEDFQLLCFQFWQYFEHQVQPIIIMNQADDCFTLISLAFIQSSYSLSNLRNCLFTILSCWLYH